MLVLKRINPMARSIVATITGWRKARSLVFLVQAAIEFGTASLSVFGFAQSIIVASLLNLREIPMTHN